jgi:hypothetical protein
MTDFDALTIKFNRLQNDFDTFKGRIEPLLVDYEQHRGQFGKVAGSRAEELLNDGRLDEAGVEVGLDRSHDGDEPDESYSRRLRAMVFGAHKADAIKPRPAAKEVEMTDEADGKLTAAEVESIKGTPNFSPPLTAEELAAKEVPAEPKKTEPDASASTGFEALETKTGTEGQAT